MERSCQIDFKLSRKVRYNTRNLIPAQEGHIDRISLIIHKFCQIWEGFVWLTLNLVGKFQPHFVGFLKKIEPEVKKLFSYKKKNVYANHFIFWHKHNINKKASLPESLRCIRHSGVTWRNFCVFGQKVLTSAKLGCFGSTEYDFLNAALTYHSNE